MTAADIFWTLLISAGAAWIISIYWSDSRARRGRQLGAWHRAEVQKDARFPGTTLRQQVLQRDQHRCVVCGATKDLHVDHFIPHSYGGQTTFDNLRVLCAPCNLRKGAKLPAGAKLPEIQGPAVPRKEKRKSGQELLDDQRRRRREAAAKGQATKEANKNRPMTEDERTAFRDRLRANHRSDFCPHCREGCPCPVLGTT